MLWECKVEKTLTKYEGLNIDIFGIHDKITDYDVEDLYQKLINITVVYCKLDELWNKELSEIDINKNKEKIELKIEDEMDERIHPFVQGFIRAILNELEESEPNLAVIDSKINEVEKMFELGGYEECLR